MRHIGRLEHQRPDSTGRWLGEPQLGPSLFGNHERLGRFQLRPNLVELLQSICSFGTVDILPLVDDREQSLLFPLELLDLCLGFSPALLAHDRVPVGEGRGRGEGRPDGWRLSGTRFECPQRQSSGGIRGHQRSSDAIRRDHGEVTSREALKGTSRAGRRPRPRSSCMRPKQRPHRARPRAPCPNTR